MARIYKQSAIYDARAAGIRNLWEPSREYMGKPTEKPNYLATVVVKKTRANWFEEPALAAFVQSCQELYSAAMSGIPFPQINWPIKDGDVDELGRAPAEWRKGHWILTGSSTSPIEVFIVQGGVPVPLKARIDVKPGDHVMVTTAIAVKANDIRGVKCYINKVVFTGPGEEIVIGNSTSATEMMAAAKAQGMNVTGFGSGAPQQGFGFGGGGIAQQGFGSAPMGAPVGQTAPGQFGTTGQASGSAFPSNPAPGGFAPPPVAPPSGNGFTPPGGFTPPTGFPPRS